MRRRKWLVVGPRETVFSIRVVNPLGKALFHYTIELESTLAATGTTAVTLSFDEPSANGKRRISWLFRHFCVLLSCTFRRQSTIVTWPVLGFFDVAFVAVFLPRHSVVVVHDPVPLVSSLGYGRLGQALCRFPAFSRRIVVHSEEARDALPPDARKNARLLPHPVQSIEEVIQTESEGKTIDVLVFGQYKKDRDLELLVATAEAHPGWSLLIAGRGWPPVPGWARIDRFIEESAVDPLLRSARACLIPYRRFFQSGVAVRAVEQRIAVIGPKCQSLELLLGNPLMSLGSQAVQ